MRRTSTATLAAEGTVIRFEIRDGIHRISCAVLYDALEAVSGLTVPSTVALRQRSFDRFRTLVSMRRRPQRGHFGSEDRLRRSGSAL